MFRPAVRVGRQEAVGRCRMVAEQAEVLPLPMPRVLLLLLPLPMQRVLLLLLLPLSSGTGCGWRAEWAWPWRWGARAGDCLRRGCVLGSPARDAAAGRARGLQLGRGCAGVAAFRPWRGEPRAVSVQRPGRFGHSAPRPRRASCLRHFCGWRGRRGLNCDWLREPWHSSNLPSHDHPVLQRCIPCCSRKKRCRDRVGKPAGRYWRAWASWL